MFSLFTFGQENCSNGVDDDANGLIDLNDPQCNCITSVTTSLIPNPSFENYSQCPNTYSQMDYVVGWGQATVATSDYFNSCGSFNFIINASGLYPGLEANTPPDGNGYVGGFSIIEFFGTTEYNQEYIGTCLLSPLMAGNNYTLKMQLGFMALPKFSGGSAYDASNYDPVDIVVYGYCTCPTFPIAGNRECPSNIDPGWQPIGSITYTPISLWTEVEININPTFDVNAIIIGTDCILNDSYISSPLTTHTPYFMYDNLILNETTIFESEFSESGAYCLNNKTLTLDNPHPNATSNQWYLDGVAILGQTGLSLNISALGLGEYTIRQLDSSGNVLQCSSFIIDNMVDSTTGDFASGIQLNDGALVIYNTTGTGSNQISPGGLDFEGHYFGSYNPGDECFIKGGEVKVFGTNAGNVCGAFLHYRVYPTGATTLPNFTNLNLNTVVDCTGGNFDDGLGPCSNGDQKWKNYNLNEDIFEGLCSGDYTFEIYYSYTGSDCDPNGCDITKYVNNSGNNFKAFFTINPAPNPTATSPQSFCDNATINDLTATGSNLQWYNAATGGSPLNGTTSLSDGQTVYVSQTIDGCESGRIPVQINIIESPTITITGDNEICVDDMTTLAVTGATNGTWTSSDNSIATVNTMGIVTGVSTGMVTIYYTIPENSPCPEITEPFTLEVLPLPNTTGIDY